MLNIISHPENANKITIRSHYILTRLAKNKSNLYSETLAGSLNCKTTLEMSLATSYETKYMSILWPRTSTHRYSSKINESIYQQKYCTKMFIVALFVIAKIGNSPVFINERMSNSLCSHRGTTTQQWKEQAADSSTNMD